jgi:hypothetical protein
MAIPDSGAPYVYTQLDASSKTALLTALKNALVASGWTLKQSDSSSVTVAFTGLPANTNTVTFDGVVYTFKTVLIQANAREVLIGASATECASNLADAINAEPGTSGTKYSNTTTAHPTCTAADSTTNCTVYGPNGFVASETLANATLNRTTAIGLGYKLDSARCPSGLQMRLMIDDDGNATMIRIRAAACDEAVVLAHNWRLNTAADRLLEFYGVKHRIFTSLLSAPLEQGCNFMAGTPALKAKNASPKIAAISDSGGLFQIETLTAHGKVTGEHVFISGGTKNTGAAASAVNGDWQITVTDTTHYTLDGSTYTAESYDADSGLSGSPSQVSRAFYVAGDDTALRVLNFRNTFGYNVGISNIPYQGVCLNQYAYCSSTANSTPSLLRIHRPTDDIIPGQSLRDLSGMANEFEAQIAWPISSSAAEPRIVGLIWNTFALSEPYPCDKVKHNFLGFNWMNYTDDWTYAKGSLWIATTPAV